MKQISRERQVHICDWWWARNRHRCGWVTHSVAPGRSLLILVHEL